MATTTSTAARSVSQLKPILKEDTTFWQKMDKPTRIQNIRELIMAKQKEMRNTVKEDLVLAYTEHFRQQYAQLFPLRPPLMLSPQNEYGMKKFISTYVRPTELPYPELYYYEGIARFVFNYVTYEPLENPIALPEVVISPANTLKCQVGDCFDISLLLVSLLIGTGYNAYCVSGYAMEHVTTNNQRVRDCPIVPTPEEQEVPEERPAFKPSKYKLKSRPVLESQFEAQSANGKSEQSTLQASIKLAKELTDDVHYGKRVHCWVVVLPKSRDIKEAFFVEPSTGETRSCSDPCYLAVESVWNHENYWVNMQKVSKVADLSFDLTNLSAWEYVFIPDKHVDEESNEKVKFDETVESGEIDEEILDIPQSWVRKLELSRPHFQSRYPGQTKRIEYKNAFLELFAEYHQKDLLIQRLTVHDNYGDVREVHHYYANRKDMLDRRSIYYIREGEKIRQRRHEWFAPGRTRDGTIEALREFITEEGIRREFRFYSEARLDGLDTRKELYALPDLTTPFKVIETYRGRTDFLSYRSVTYDLSIEKPKPQPGQTLSYWEKAIIKMTEKFDRNTSKIAHEDVQKRTYYIRGNRIKLWYHYEEGKITRVIKEYGDNNEFSIDIIDPFMRKPKWIETVEESHSLITFQNMCERYVRQSDISIEQIVKTRIEEEQDIQYTTSIYDTLRNKPTEEEIREKEESERKIQEKRAKKDILGNLIPQGGIKDSKQALDIYFAALGQFKKRLVVRGHIIHDRLVQEKQNLNHQKQLYHKNPESMEKNEDTYMQYVEDLLFKINILKNRFDEHKKKSVEQFNELKRQLLADERLRQWDIEKELKKRDPNTAKRAESRLSDNNFQYGLNTSQQQ